MTEAQADNPRLALGIDIGGTGTKAAVVDVSEGRLVTDRLRIATPQPAGKDELAGAIKELVQPLLGEGHFDAAGIGFPAVVKNGIALTAANIPDEWLYADVGRVIGEALGHECAVMNDADAAGLAEMRFGAGRGVMGNVVVVTLGTGVGTSLFVDGKLVPNTELARMQVRGKPAWERVPNSVREKKKLSWEQWTADVNEFLQELDHMTWPEMIIIGGGVSADAHKFFDSLNCRCQLVPARLRNEAGIVGAAVFAAELAAVRV